MICHSSAVERWLRLKEPKAARLKRVMRASGGVQDVASGHALLRQDNPEWVLIGNSMLHSRIESDYLERLCGHNVYKLSISSTKSPMWFLMLKLLVVRSGVKPKCVTVFFRDRELTWPVLRMNRNAEMIERLNGRDEPEWRMVMADYEAAIEQRLARLVKAVSGGMEELLPAEKLREWARGKIQKTAFDLTGFGGARDPGGRRDEVNSLLSMDHQRKDGASASLGIAPEIAEDSDDPEPLAFDPSPAESFLPHMVELSRQHGFTLHFHRIKTNPDLAPTGSESERTLPAYLRDLRAYLESHGCLYTDESGEPGITGDMYVDDAHIKSDEKTQPAYMEVFWRNVKSSLPVLRTATSAAQAPQSSS